MIRHLTNLQMYYTQYNAYSVQILTATPEQALAFLQSHGVVRTAGECPKCHIPLSDIKYRSDTDYQYMECCKCGHKESVYKDSYLYKKQLDCRMFSLFVYHFAISQVGSYRPGSVRVRLRTLVGPSLSLSRGKG